MKLRIDEEKCIACGVCSSICPDVFQPRDDGIASIVVPESELDNFDCIQDAIDSCPTEAIISEQ
ncbi:ferredoxin [bacterium]|nr:MAG: ferredoxin [bacterium]